MEIEKKAMACLQSALCSILPFVSFSLLISSNIFCFLVISIPLTTKPRNLGDHIHHFYFLKHLASPPTDIIIINTTNNLMATSSGHLSAHSLLELFEGFCFITHLPEGHFLFGFTYFFQFYFYLSGPSFSISFKRS